MLYVACFDVACVVKCGQATPDDNITCSTYSLTLAAALAALHHLGYLLYVHPHFMYALGTSSSDISPARTDTMVVCTLLRDLYANSTSELDMQVMYGLIIRCLPQHKCHQSQSFPKLPSRQMTACEIIS